MALRRSHIEPAHGLRVIFRDAETVKVRVAKHELRSVEVEYLDKAMFNTQRRC